jgi:lactose/L-arabinose transport system permease protein
VQDIVTESKKPIKKNQVVKKRKGGFITPKNVPYVLLAPTLLLFLVFYVYPIISSFLLSFKTRVNGEYVFAGLDNYTRMLQDPLFYKALGNSAIILLVQVPLMLSLAVLLAVAVNSSFLKFKGVFRIGFFTPVLTSLVAASVIFLLILNKDYGLLNYLLSLIGIEPIGWLSDGYWPLVTLIIVTTWRWAGYNMVIILAGLQNIPGELYEAASIDGASKLKQFFYVTLPQLKPVLLVTFIMSTIGSFQLFDEPFTMTHGGPNNRTLTITLYLYQHGFKYFDFGYASAITYAVVFIIAVLSFVQFKMAGEKD